MMCASLVHARRMLGTCTSMCNVGTFVCACTSLRVRNTCFGLSSSPQFPHDAAPKRRYARYTRYGMSSSPQRQFPHDAAPTSAGLFLCLIKASTLTHTLHTGPHTAFFAPSLTAAV